MIKKSDFEKIVQDKITKFIPIIQNKRWTKKFISNLTLAYNKEPLYVSLSAKKM